MVPFGTLLCFAGEDLELSKKGEGKFGTVCLKQGVLGAAHQTLIIGL